LIGRQEPIVDRRNLLLGAGDRAGWACSMTKSPRTPAERPGLRGSAARRLPRTPSAACQRAALHGPGHWHHAAPDEVPWIVRRWLRDHPQTQTSCAPMPSRPQPEGPMTFRPCSDARADKTDLHAYDGDRPKLSHRTERRLGVSTAKLFSWPRTALRCRNLAFPQHFAPTHPERRSGPGGVQRPRAARWPGFTAHSHTLLPATSWPLGTPVAPRSFRRAHCRLMAFWLVVEFADADEGRRPAALPG
jgi:hypothetical protein